MAKLLIIEDDRALAAKLQAWLMTEGHVVELCHDGRDALQMLEHYKYDLIVLDLGLPTVGGIPLLQKFRTDGGNTAVLILTGQGDLESKRSGFDSGADDYLVKPFAPEELSARIKAILRRPASLLPSKLEIGNVTIDGNAKMVMVDGEQLALTKREYAVLEFLTRHPNQCFGSQELLSAVWPSDTDSSEEAVRACIKNLRNKLKEATSTCVISTERTGYVIKIES